MLNTPYIPLMGEESVGTHGAFGIKIEVTGSDLPDLSSRAMPSAIWSAAHNAVKEIKSAIMAEKISTDPKEQEKARLERLELLACFSGPIFVSAIPNGYCSDYCCRHLPWFKVTTSIGHFEIGWRKRVISLDWSKTIAAATAGDLFQKEDVTKGQRSIHAWSIEKAKQYIEAVTNSVTNSVNLNPETKIRP
jgi:hypothetical protein